jgi:hypothetical protein
MYVYHGTAASDVDKILEEGIKPRKSTGKSNWDANEMESISEHVYLTTIHAPYFGLAATDESEFAIIEIDLDMLEDRSLYPDEDFIEQSLNPDVNIDIEGGDLVDMDGDMVERTEQVREHIEVFQPYWKASFEVLGNISYKGTIPPEAITRVSEVDPPSSVRLAIDPVMRIEAVQTTRGKYEMYTKLLMGDDVDKVEYLVHSRGVPIPANAQPSEVMDEDDIEQLERTVGGDELEQILGQDYVEIRENTAYSG